jgi:hypothetical protein
VGPERTPILEQINFTALNCVGWWFGDRMAKKKQMNNSLPKDVLTAATPTIAMFSLGQINEIAALIGSILGIAFLLWRWRREAVGKGKR